MEGQTRIAEHEGEHVEDGHEKKSMFHSVKDKVKKMNAKVKKNIRARQGHGENLDKNGGEDEEEEENDEEEEDQARRKSDENVVDVETLRAQNNPHIINYKDDNPIKEPERMWGKEDQSEGLFHSKGTEQGRSATGISVPITETHEIETDVGIPSTTEKAGESQAEATESALQDKVSEVGEVNELASNTKPPPKVTEEFKSGPSPKVPEEVESGESGPSKTSFSDMSEASGLAQGSNGLFSSKKSSDDDVEDTALLGEHEGQEDGGPQQQQTEAQGVHNAKENSEEFESNSDPKLCENPEDEESQRLARDTQGDASEGEGAELPSNAKPPNFPEEVNSGNSENIILRGDLQGKEDEGLQQQQSEAEGEDLATRPNSGENPKEDESQSLARKAQDKVSEVGEGNKLASNTKPPFSTEEVNSGNSEDIMLPGELQGKEDEGLQQQQSEAEGEDLATGPNSGENLKEDESQSLARKAQDKVSAVGEGNELASNTKPPNFTEEVKSVTPETGSGFIELVSDLSQGLKDIVLRNQSNNENVKDTALQEESKGQEDGGPHQQQSEAEVETGQSYAQKLYAAKSAIQSKMGYGGQTNQENNGTRELQSGDPTQSQGPTSGSGTEAVEDAKEGKKSQVVSKLSPGEDEKALSKVITEAVSNSARSVKDTIVGGFYGGKEKSSATTETTMDPSQSPTKSTSSNPSGGKGIVDRATEVVGSFVGRKFGENAEISPSSQKQELDSVEQVEKQMSKLQLQEDQQSGKSELQKEESTAMEQ